jgi:hypothetical protein
MSFGLASLNDLAWATFEDENYRMLGFFADSLFGFVYLFARLRIIPTAAIKLVPINRSVAGSGTA